MIREKPLAYKPRRTWHWRCTCGEWARITSSTTMSAEQQAYRMVIDHVSKRGQHRAIVWPRGQRHKAARIEPYEFHDGDPGWGSEWN